MINEDREQQIDQLLRGVYRMCLNRDDCNGCPFYMTKCTFEEPKPRTWFDEETIEIKAAPDIEKPAEPEKTVVEDVVEQQKENSDANGTWLVSTTMGSVFTKYVFICSKCGYKKESVFSITPMTFCPECERRKAGLT